MELGFDLGVLLAIFFFHLGENQVVKMKHFLFFRGCSAGWGVAFGNFEFDCPINPFLHGTSKT